MTSACKEKPYGNLLQDEKICMAEVQFASNLGDQYVQWMRRVGNSPCLQIMSCVGPVAEVLCIWDEHGSLGY